MADLNINRVLSVPGRFCYGPTDLSAAFPHGGTALGYVGEIAYRPNISYEGFPGEEYGDAFVARLRYIGTGAVSAVLRQWDEDALALHWPDTTATADDNVRISVPGTARSGDEVTGEGIVLLFSPLDPRNPGALFFNAIPELDETLQLRFNLSDDLVTAVSFACMRDSTGRDVQVDILDNLSAVYP